MIFGLEGFFNLFHDSRQTSFFVCISVVMLFLDVRFRWCSFFSCFSACALTYIRIFFTCPLNLRHPQLSSTHIRYIPNAFSLSFSYFLPHFLTSILLFSANKNFVLFPVLFL